MARNYTADIIVEEKTPKGIVLKVMVNKWKFLAFDSRGSSIYADSSDTKLLHDVPFIVFVGADFIMQDSYRSELAFLKVVRNRIVLPYQMEGENMRKYVFVDRKSDFDILPARVKKIDNVAMMVRELDKAHRPDYIIVDRKVTRGDIVVIKNRLPDTSVILAGEGGGHSGKAADAADGTDGVRATDLVKEVNLNVLSENPVFLARVHLRQLDFSKTNQLLLDFDLTAVDAEYILTFIETMIKRSDGKDELERNIAKLRSLEDSFRFYAGLMRREEEGVREMIEKIANVNEVFAFLTLIAKVKTLMPETGDRLALTDYENLLYEKQESFHS